MARRTHVPKFGNWDANDHMPFTVVFNNARQGRGKPINPNDPSENPALFGEGRGDGAPAPGRRFNPNDPQDSEAADLHVERPSLPGSREREVERPSLPGSREREVERPSLPGSREGSSLPGSREGSSRGQLQQQAQAGARRQVAVAPMQANGMPSRPPPTDPRRGSRDNFPERVESPSASFSADSSPGHQGGNYGGHGNQGTQGRGNRGGSPAWDARRKSPSEDGALFAPATPNRSRLRGNKEDGSGKGPSAALPKFGAWDAQDPGSGDGFTVIFNNARNEKKTGGPVNIPRTPDHKHSDDLYMTNHANNAGHQKSHGSKRNWFCWCGQEASP